MVKGSDEKISKGFVDVTTAKRLAKIGFNEPCMAYHELPYTHKDVKYPSKFIINFNNAELTEEQKKRPTMYSPTVFNSFLNSQVHVAAPTWDAVIEWFDKQGLYIDITPEFYTTGINWNWQIFWYIPKDEWTYYNQKKKVLTEKSPKGDIPYDGPRNFTSGTAMYGDNNEYPTRPKANKAAIERAIKIYKQGKPYENIKRK